MTNTGEMEERETDHGGEWDSLINITVADVVIPTSIFLYITLLTKCSQTQNILLGS